MPSTFQKNKLHRWKSTGQLRRSYSKCLKTLPIVQVNICRISSSNRLFVPDSKSGKSFLIDTGADVSVIPPKTINRDIKANNNHTLFAANGTAIHTYGTTRLTLRRPFTWIFTIADTKIPIIGSDFLQHFNILVDLKNSKLVVPVTHGQ